MQISVIICTYNRCKLLEKTLMSFKTLHDLGNVELIVVDNNSTDDTKKVIGQCEKILSSIINIKYILEKEQGLSYARNTGINYANGDIIAFLDDDAIPSVGWLMAIRKGFGRYVDVMAIGGKVLPAYESQKPNWLSREELYSFLSIVDLGDIEQNYPKNNFPFGVNMAFRSYILKKYKFAVELGRKGTSLLSGEETLLFKEILKEGQIYYIPAMQVTHFIPKERLAMEWFLSRFYAQGMTDVILNSKYSKKIKIMFINKRILAYLYRKIKYILFGYNDEIWEKCLLEYEKGAMHAIFLKKY